MDLGRFCNNAPSKIDSYEVIYRAIRPGGNGLRLLEQSADGAFGGEPREHAVHELDVVHFREFRQKALRALNIMLLQVAEQVDSKGPTQSDFAQVIKIAASFRSHIPKYFSESILELRTTLWAPQAMEAGGNFHNGAVLYPNAPLFSRSRWAVYEHEFLLTCDLWVNVISPILTGDSYKYESLGKQARDTKRKAEDLS